MTNLELIQAHHESTKFCSFQNHMRLASTSYSKIIEKGYEIVPDILNFLKNEDQAGMSEMMLLMDILKFSHAKPEQNTNMGGFVAWDVQKSKEEWIQWGISQKLIS